MPLAEKKIKYKQEKCMKMYLRLQRKGRYKS